MEKSNPLEAMPLDNIQNSDKLIQFMDLNDNENKKGPLISNIAEIDKIEDNGARFSKKQPQSSPINQAGFNEFFAEDAPIGGQSSLSTKFDLDESQSWENNNNDNQSESKSLKERIFGNYKKYDGPITNEDIFWDIIKFLQKPSSLITIALISILVIMTFQYDSLQKEFKGLSKKLKYEQDQRNVLQKQMKNVNKELKHVENVENDLVKKENKLEKNIEEKEKKEKESKGSWGDDNMGEGHEIHMQPLKVHTADDFFGGIQKRMQQDMQSLFGGGSSSPSDCDSPLGCDDPTGSIGLGQPHIIKIHFGSPFSMGSPFGGNPFSSMSQMSTSSSDLDAALGEPSMSPQIKMIKLSDILGGLGPEGI